jgi:hypothetical protein
LREREREREREKTGQDRMRRERKGAELEAQRITSGRTGEEEEVRKAEGRGQSGINIAREEPYPVKGGGRTISYKGEVERRRDDRRKES